MSLQTSKQSFETRVLQDRIQTFYKLLNEKKWQECFELIDPKLKDDGRITHDNYVGSLSSFFSTFGPLENVSVRDVKLYSNRRNNKHDKRDFAYGESFLTDRQNHSHRVQERWVKADDGYWYTRMVGLL